MNNFIEKLEYIFWIILAVIIALLVITSSVIAEEDAYIQFPDGSLVENPFNGEFFAPETDPQNIPLGFANPRQTIPALVDESDPAGIGTSCNLYQGELDLVKTLKERYGLNTMDAMRCLDLMNVAGKVIAAQFAEKEKSISAKQFLDDIEEMDVSNSIKIRYQRVVRDTIRALKSGKVKVDIRNGSYEDEEGRNRLFVGVISNCVHSAMK